MCSKRSPSFNIDLPPWGGGPEDSVQGMLRRRGGRQRVELFGGSGEASALPEAHVPHGRLEDDAHKGTRETAHGSCPEKGQAASCM